MVTIGTWNRLHESGYVTDVEIPAVLETQATQEIRPLCVACDLPLIEAKGKWACGDISRPKYGVEQRLRKGRA